ncbi:hypothetical protein [Hyphococcus sp.]
MKLERKKVVFTLTMFVMVVIAVSLTQSGQHGQITDFLLGLFGG